MSILLLVLLTVAFFWARTIALDLAEATAPMLQATNQVEAGIHETYNKIGLEAERLEIWEEDIWPGFEELKKLAEEREDAEFLDELDDIHYMLVQLVDVQAQAEQRAVNFDRDAMSHYWLASDELPQLSSLYQALDEALDDLGELQNHRVREDTLHIRHLGKVVPWAMLVLMVALIGLAIVTAYQGTHAIAQPIKRLLLATKKLARGKLREPVRVTRKDEIGELTISFNKMMEALGKSQKENEDLLLNILPASIAKQLKSGQLLIADDYAEVSVLFSDIAGFSEISASHSAEEMVSLLNELFSRFDELTEQHQVEKIKTIGDAYMVVAGAPVYREDHAKALAELALEMLGVVQQYNETHDTNYAIRIGINSGPVTAGVLGTKRFSYDVWGETVNVAKRMEAEGESNRIQVSEKTHDLLQDDYIFESREKIVGKQKEKMKVFILKEKKSPSRSR